MSTGKKGVVKRNIQHKQGPTGDNYLLVISIDAYKYAPPLSNCVKDAKALVDILTSKYNFVKKRGNIQLITHLINEQATRKNILKKLTELKRKVTSNDNLLIYFSGHGETEDNTGFWIPVEAHPNEEDEFISTNDITRKLDAINSFHTFLIVDACFSGSLFANYKNIKASVESKPSRWGLAASHSREVAFDGNLGENSPFAHQLLKVLKENDVSLSIHELSNELIKEVARMTKQKQTPVFQPLDVRGHKLGQYVFHLKEEKEVQLVKEIEILIKEGMEQINSGQFRQAKRNFVRLLNKVEEEIENEHFKKDLSDSIEEQISICNNIPKYKPIIEKIVQKEYDSKKEIKKSVQEVERIVEVIKEVPVEVEVIKEIIKEVEVEVIREVIKEVEVPVEVIKEVIREVIREVEVPVEVEVIREVIKEVEVPVEVEVIREVIKEVEVPVEVIKEIEVPVEVIKEVEVVKGIDFDMLQKMMSNMTNQKDSKQVIGGINDNRKVTERREGIEIRKKDDLKKIEGIGPKLQSILNDAGIFTLRVLSQTKVEHLKSILASAGNRYKFHDPTSWPRQAELAADGEWEKLKKLQDRLDGGR